MKNLLILITLFLTFNLLAQSTEQVNEKKIKAILGKTIDNEKKIKATLDEAADIVRDLTTAAEIEVSGTITDSTRQDFYQLIKEIKSQKNLIKLNLTEIKELKKIEKKTFEKCSNLQDITLPNDITYIGYRAFADCSTLSNIIIPDKVTSIGYQAFSGCTKLTGVTIGHGITNIEEATFSDCKSVETLIIGNKTTSLKNLPITSALKSITIGSNVKSIDSNTFAKCENLTSVNFKIQSWYISDNSNSTNGVQIEVRSPEGNAINLRKNYCTKYWYTTKSTTYINDRYQTRELSDEEYW